MDACIKELYRIGIVPVVALEDAADALPLGAALKKGGVSAIEVTFRTAAAADAIRLLTREMPELLVGAGTVITKEQADAAIEAGAKFIVSPGFQPELVSYVLSKGVPMCPGTATPGEMEQAMALGLSAVKFFPAEQNGGAPMLKALSAPYRDLLMHDWGEGLADERPDYLASGRDWRTAPLWGIGLAQRLSPSAGFLHDGRARSLSEAILWHGGEALPARERFVALPRENRQALLAFLGSL